jgi:polysaccharide chain length determinant protein (PEP-CTERM system associated)
MLGHRELTMEDYVAMLRRRLWVIIIPAILGPVLAYGVSLGLPEQYTSQTLVLVEGQKVPESVVRSFVSDNLQQRLGTMQEQIFSRTRLQPIIEKFQLYKDEWNKVPMEDLVGRLRAGIRVRPVNSVVRTREGELPGFYVYYTANEPKLAQMICREITEMFMSENLRLREQRSQGTVQFLQTQLDGAKAELDKQDAKLAAFKQKYVGQLPGQEQTNLNILMGLTTQLEAVNTLLNRAQQDKVYMEAQLDQQLAAWNASQQGTNPQTLEQQLTKAQSDLAALRVKYEEDHPDVRKARKEIDDLKQRIAQAVAEGKQNPPQKTESAATLEPPQIQQLRSNLYQLQTTIAERTKEQARLQQDIRTFQSRVQLSPRIEQEFKELTRDYDTALTFYRDMLTKKTQSEMAADLDKRQQGEQFSVMDGANLPERPSYPNRPLFAAGGFAGGIGLGLGIALLLELRDKVIRNERDIEYYLGVPTLALVPSVGEAAAGRSKLWSREQKVA